MRNIYEKWLTMMYYERMYKSLVDLHVKRKDLKTHGLSDHLMAPSCCVLV